jgi:hypothetical protein
MVLQILPSNLAAAETVRTELSRWETNYVDVAALKTKAEQAEKDKETLAEKLALLDRRIQVSHVTSTVTHRQVVCCRVEALRSSRSLFGVCGGH